jgi:uncharacterized repeat protein (TIGR02543 family)
VIPGDLDSTVYSVWRNGHPNYSYRYINISDTDSCPYLSEFNEGDSCILELQYNNKIYSVQTDVKLESDGIRKYLYFNYPTYGHMVRVGDGTCSGGSSGQRNWVPVISSGWSILISESSSVFRSAIWSIISIKRATTITENTNLYAVATPITYNIVYNQYVGSSWEEISLEPATYSTGTPPTLPTPTRTGYVFDNWYTSSDLTTLTTITENTFGNQSLYAKFIPNVYDITYFDGESQVLGLIDTYTYGVGLTLPTYTKDGYTFNGWYDNALFVGDPITSIGASEVDDKIFYAKTTLI